MLSCFLSIIYKAKKQKPKGYYGGVYVEKTPLFNTFFKHYGGVYVVFLDMQVNTQVNTQPVFLNSFKKIPIQKKIRYGA